MALNALSLSVAVGYAGYSFKSKVNGLTAGSEVDIRRVDGDGFGYSNGFVRSEGLPTPDSYFDLVEFLPSTGERRTTRLGVQSKRYDLDAAAALAAAPGAKASVSAVPYDLFDGSRSWATAARSTAGTVITGGASGVIINPPTPTPEIPPILTPFTIGVNGAGTQGYQAGFLNRDLALGGEWIVIGGALNNQKLPFSMIDRQTFFPTSIPSDATAAQLSISNGRWMAAMGEYSLSIDSRFTVTNIATDGGIVLTGGTGGTGTISITGAGRQTGWALRVTGPFASLTATQRGLRILPANDANPERLYSDAYRAMLETIGAREYRVMEDNRTNDFSAETYQMFGDFGAKTGTTGSPIDAIVQLCNDLNLSLYYCFHPATPLAQINRIFDYVSKNLKKGLGFTPEFSNEIWNTAFLARMYLQEKGWRAGLYGNAGNGTKPACLGWEDGGQATFLGGSTNQPFQPNYRVDPANGSEPFKGKTLIPLTAGTYIIGGIYGNDNLVFYVANDVPVDYVFPAAGDANIVLQANGNALENGKWRYYSERSQALLAGASTYWLAQGHSADKLYVALNVQSGPALGPDDLILSWPDGSFKLKNFEMNMAPYWKTIDGDVGDLTTEKTLDNVAIGDRASIITQSTWVKIKRNLLQGIMPSGRTLPIRASGTYEVNHHNGFKSGVNGPAKFATFRRDPRTGHNLKLAMTYFGIENPGGYFRLFNLISGENPGNTTGWGVFFTQNEAVTGPLVNPEAIALKEWTTAAATGIPVADIFCALNPDEGAFQVQIQFGPQVSQAISGVLRVSAGTASATDVTGGLPLDIPFTKAAGALVATVTVPVIDDTTVEADETLILSIVPQPGVFTIGSLSQSVTVTLRNNDVASALPQANRKMVDFNPSAMAQQTDGTPFSRSLIDTVSGIEAVQPTSANQPTWVANASGGKPGLRNASGSQWLNVNAPGIFKTIIDSRIYTIIDLVVNTTAAGGGSVGGGSSNGLGFAPACDGTFVGPAGANNNRVKFPYAATAPSAIGYTNTTANKGGAAGSGLTRTYVHGMCVSCLEGQPVIASNTSNYALLAINSTGALPAKTTLLRRLVFDVELTPAEYLQWVLALYTEYGITHPLAATDAVKLFEGDSNVSSVGASAANSLPVLVAQANGWALGTWGLSAIGGSNINTLAARAASDVDGVISASGKRGILFEQCRVNDQAANITVANGITLHGNYVAARKAANPTVKVFTQTPADWLDSIYSPNPEAWTQALITNFVSMGYAGLARVDLNSVVGSNGGVWDTYPVTPPSPRPAPFDDGLHFTTYANQASVVAPVMAGA